jgi:cytochrome c553
MLKIIYGLIFFVLVSSQLGAQTNFYPKRSAKELVNEYGSLVYNRSCASCHDNARFYPILHGQSVEYLVTQLEMYLTMERIDLTMNHISNSTVAKQETIRFLSEYLSDLDPCRLNNQNAENDLPEIGFVADIEAGQKIYENNCVNCHFAKGNSSIPIIKGHSAAYLLKTLNDYKLGARESEDMIKVLENLTQQNFKDVSAYLSIQYECR